MRFIRDSGFIIRRINLGDADRIVTIFSKQNGKIKVIAKGVRKITSRRSAFLEPLNLIEFHAVQSHSRRVLTEVQLVSSFPQNKKNLKNYQKIFELCEIIDSLCGEDEILSSIYEQIYKFTNNKKRYSSFLRFKTDLLVNLGYWNAKKRFSNEDQSYRYIESIIERKLKSRTINF